MEHFLKEHLDRLQAVINAAVRKGLFENCATVVAVQQSFDTIAQSLVDYEEQANLRMADNLRLQMEIDSIEQKIV